MEGPLANDQALGVGITASAALVLLAVLMMRYNVVIGGQEISKTGKGLLAYQPTILGREGILAAATVLVLPLYYRWWCDFCRRGMTRNKQHRPFPPFGRMMEQQ